MREVSAARQRRRRIDDRGQHAPRWRTALPAAAPSIHGAAAAVAADRPQVAVEHEHTRRRRPRRGLPGVATMDRGAALTARLAPTLGEQLEVVVVEARARMRRGRPRSSPSSRARRGRRPRRRRRCRRGAGPRPSAASARGRRRSRRSGCSPPGRARARSCLAAKSVAGVLELERARKAGAVVVLGDAAQGSKVSGSASGQHQRSKPMTRCRSAIASRWTDSQSRLDSLSRSSRSRQRPAPARSPLCQAYGGRKEIPTCWDCPIRGAALESRVNNGTERSSHAPDEKTSVAARPARPTRSGSGRDQWSRRFPTNAGEWHPRQHVGDLQQRSDGRGEPDHRRHRRGVLHGHVQRHLDNQWLPDSPSRRERQLPRRRGIRRDSERRPGHRDLRPRRLERLFPRRPHYCDDRRRDRRTRGPARRASRGRDGRSFRPVPWARTPGVSIERNRIGREHERTEKECSSSGIG